MPPHTISPSMGCRNISKVVASPLESPPTPTELPTNHSPVDVQSPSTPTIFTQVDLAPSQSPDGRSATSCAASPVQTSTYLSNIEWRRVDNRLHPFVKTLPAEQTNYENMMVFVMEGVVKWSYLRADVFSHFVTLEVKEED